MKFLTFGEIMLRLKSPGLERFFQSPMLEATFGGGEANVAVSLANYEQDVAYLTVLPGNMADRIEIYERPVGTQDWAYSPLTQAFEERPLHLPLPAEQDSPSASAAAIAVNQAYRKYLANEYDALKELRDQYSIGDGFSMIFFDRYFAIGFFKDGLLDSFDASYYPGVYNGEQRRIEMVNLLGGNPDNPYDPDYPQKALEELLIGQTMPLDPAQYGAAGDLAAYQVAGIILALNDAYQNSLAGQQ